MNIEEIVALLRQTESRSKRKLLDEAADAIEELAKTSIVKRIPCEVDPRKEYVELDGIRIVSEEGQIVGWYRPGDGMVIDANAPTVDAVPVVRCRECKHCDPETHHCDHHMGTAAPIRRKPDDFCSYGERKEGADNAEYIEREALMRRIKEIHCAECDSYHGLRCRACWVDDTLDYIDSEPAADVATVRHAKWNRFYKSGVEVDEGFVSSCCDMWNERI